jgi:predicted alpha/beta-hydrolase family hydrolase
MVELLWSGPEGGPTLILAHGAGGPMDSPWMTEVSELLSARGIRVARFEFAYMASRREGGRRPPPKVEKLADEYSDVVAQVRAHSPGPLFIGGKSLGGRVASLIVDESRDNGAVNGLVCVGYPFHPPGKPEKLRTAHLRELKTPTLICQGERDPFGTHDDVAGYELSPTIRLLWALDGNHELTPRKGVTGLTLTDNLERAADGVLAFMSA